MFRLHLSGHNAVARARTRVVQIFLWNRSHYAGSCRRQRSKLKISPEPTS
jgi:hypothetical protein